MNHLEISGRLLIRNTLLNFLGQAVPLVVGIITIPFIVRGLGTERFGLLSLAWVIVGYFAIFDLGLGRATTKFVAEALSNGDEDQIPRIVWTTVTIQVVLGLVGAIVLAAISSVLAERMLSIPPQLLGEAKTTFYVLASSIPIVLVSSSFSGVLEAAQRFDLANAVKILSGIFTYLLPLVGVLLGFNLPAIVASIIVARFVALSALVVLAFHIFPKLQRFSAHFALFPRLFFFGGWVTVTSTIGFVLVYLDRFLIASLLSINVVAYYTAPYEAITRLWIIPASLVITLFPAFSTLEGTGDRQRLAMLFARVTKYVLLVEGPIVVILVFLAEDILAIWLGSDFATGSKAVLQILALGVLASAIAQIPYALLQGIGRPDILAKYHLIELVPYVSIAWGLVTQWGIVGAAMGFTLRLIFAALVLPLIALKACRLSPRLFATNDLMLTSLILLVLVGVAYGLKSLARLLPLLFQLALFAALLGLLAWAVWRKLLSVSERETMLSLGKRIRQIHFSNEVVYVGEDKR